MFAWKKPYAILIVSALMFVVPGCSRPLGGQASNHAAVSSGMGQQASLDRSVEVTEPLHDPSRAGIAVPDALRRIGKHVPLPDPAVAGIQKVVLFQDPENPASFELGVLFSSGLELGVYSQEWDLKDWANQAAGRQAAYADGKVHGAMEKVSGKDVFVRVGGKQTQPMTPDNVVPTMLMWNQDGYGYVLLARSGDAAPLDDMRSIVERTQ